MAGVRIMVTGQEETLQQLIAISARLANAQPMFDEIGAALAVSTQNRFQAGRGPDNSVWPPSLRAAATGGKTLVDTARLMQSITHNATASGVEVGTNVEYAATHQFGATIRAKTSKGLRWRYRGKGGNVDRFATKQQVTIPRRAFLGIDADDETEILTIAADYAGGTDAR